ncbi:MAG: glutamine synthetase III [Clostridiales bacterium]|nr:glutamine synthetase III [Candidatus Crickella merdequi]
MVSAKVTDYFGSMVFGEETMKEHLSSASFAAWKNCITEGTPLDIGTANEIAEAMKHWAISHGATHYTHWFQPLTGVTAEKHDGFISKTADGKVIMEFSGKELIKGEPDASSFPSGGLRSTFEARGYTSWDPTSFAFIKEGSLCIPTIFCSYSGEALDKKTPLLRSMEAVSKEAVRILRLFGDQETKRVTAMVGPEQEYFLIDKELYKRREDLRMTGRTLFGAKPPRGQELDDHYFGAIKPRVAAYMKDLDEELWRLGVLAKTKHNEVAPSQHEMAPIYCDANMACDHNQLTMELMQKVADRHGLQCLLHEKPFAYVNGSGKHDNWSLSTDKGENLFKPGKTPENNLRFLLFLTAFIKGVDDYQEMLRATVASPGNDHRLGAQEAPPAIMSIFLGTALSAVVDSIIEEKEYSSAAKRSLEIGVDVLPQIHQDNTDRNRTSPMAFTGNKFEFRSLGSSQSISGPNTMLNTMMAEELRQFADELEESLAAAGEDGKAATKKEFEKTVYGMLRRILTDHKRIIFNGNGYDDAWVEEAEKRGLSNLKSTADALAAFEDEKNIDLYVRQGVYGRDEIIARGKIKIENYITSISIEARTMTDMLCKDILPAVSAYAAELGARIEAKKRVGLSCSYESETAAEIAELTDALHAETKTLKKLMAEIPADESLVAHYCHDVVVPSMGRARGYADQLELRIDKSAWPYPTYIDMLFSEI